MANRFDFTLDTVEASILGRAMDVDVRQFPLRIGNTTLDPARYARLGKQVYLAMEERGLSVSGELHSQVRLAFELLGRHHLSVAVSGTDKRTGDIALLAVTDGAQALLIAQLDEENVLRWVLFPDDELVNVLVSALPQTPAAPGGPLTVRQQATRELSAMAARRQAEEEFDEEETEAFGSLQVGELVEPGTAPRGFRASDEELLTEVLSAPRLGGGYFVATGRTRHGERRTGTPLTWLDTEDGRYLVETSTDQGGTMTARYSPATSAQTADAVQRLISEVY
ncbi:ESX secretion-associated protein EspG [Amycolatopsis rhizosphaerae]|uniref:ESX secretion-associated protein EspG n=1 Tax=Amycolatopsis rhizosphaerae TaxID=2053003 RepID=A0A558APX5_9PSEU|nr:ESX secretion-associated protein EspG [Amycolatopsis rhizosphaerae]TVT26315.1 ESX secretion-associated protein EspG [Amycolatopsis rhizosphaerae]